MPKIKNEVATQEVVAKPYWTTTDGVTVRLYLGDVRERLAEMEEGSVQMAVTSPPYWALRDYGTATWEGGDPNCDHKMPEDWFRSRFRNSSTLGNSDVTARAAASAIWAKGGLCKTCGAKRIDQQLGSEEIPDCLGWAGKFDPRSLYRAIVEITSGSLNPKDMAQVIVDLITRSQSKPCGQCFICHMVAVFHEVKRVLRDDGTLWLNIGDTYGGTSHNSEDSHSLSTVGVDGLYSRKIRQFTSGDSIDFSSPKTGLDAGNLVGIPWRLALALQADGWVLRQDLIWSKPSPMPESVQNRCTKSHEYIFLLTKSEKYFYDAEAIREEVKIAEPKMLISQGQFSGPRVNEVREFERVCGANKRSVWTDKDTELIRWMLVNCPEKLEEFLRQSGNKNDVWSLVSSGYKKAHYATFGTKLITPCVLAGTSAFGCCDKCGAPWRRTVEVVGDGEDRFDKTRNRTDSSYRQSGIGAPIGHKRDTPGQTPQGNTNLRKGYDRSVKRNRNNITGSLEATTSAYKEVIDDWVPTCECRVEGVVPCTVLDPFMGSGTTAIVALTNGRRAVGIDLSKDYLDQHAIHRIEQWLVNNDVKELVPDLSRWQPVITAPEAKGLILGESAS